MNGVPVRHTGTMLLYLFTSDFVIIRFFLDRIIMVFFVLFFYFFFIYIAKMPLF